jgi:hypothetical protein
MTMDADALPTNSDIILYPSDFFWALYYRIWVFFQLVLKEDGFNEEAELTLSILIKMQLLILL